MSKKIITSDKTMGPFFRNLSTKSFINSHSPKLLNFCSNLAALLFFIFNGSVLWQAGIAMLLGQALGAYGGARLVLSHGKRLIKSVMVVVALAITLKMLVSSA